MNNRDFVISHMHGKLYVNFTLFPATCSEEFLRILPCYQLPVQRTLLKFYFGCLRKYQLSSKHCVIWSKICELRD